MVYTALSALVEQISLSPLGVIVTAVLPGGCPLACPFCIVNQRDERREESYLSADHLTGMLDAIERRGLLGGAAIVGDEPLQAHCWPMAEAFLGAATQKKIPTALITNGYNLIDFTDRLLALPKTKITTSLDAASEKHDEIRRKPGAFARISAGIKLATSYPELRERLSIATILMPGNLNAISEIIDFTAANDIPQLIVSPLLTSSRTTPLTVHPRVMKEAWQELPQLHRQAEDAGVKLRVSDEFAMLGPWEDKLRSIGLDVLTPRSRARLIRVDAAGRVETLDSMRIGVETGLHLPADLSEMDSFAGKVAELCADPISVAA